MESKKNKRFLTWTMPSGELGGEDVEFYEIYSYEEPLCENADDDDNDRPDKWELIGRRKALEFPLTKVNQHRFWLYVVKEVLIVSNASNFVALD